MAEDNLEKLKSSRDKLAQVYKDEACDELPDIHKAILHIQNAIIAISKRGN